MKWRQYLTQKVEVKMKEFIHGKVPEITPDTEFVFRKSCKVIACISDEVGSCRKNNWEEELLDAQYIAFLHLSLLTAPSLRIYCM